MYRNKSRISSFREQCKWCIVGNSHWFVKLFFFFLKESEIIEKRKPDGTIVRVRRRAVKLTVHQPVRMTIRSHPPTKKEPVPEDDLSYEEIPVDENSPVHFDKNVSFFVIIILRFFINTTLLEH